jgi:hypothetical protein
MPSLSPANQRQVEVSPTDAAGRPIALESLAGTLTAAGSGRSIPLDFEEVASNRWVATVPELPGGEYEYALSSRGAGSLTGLLAIPYSAEYRLGRVDTTPLGPLAAATGGTTLDVADPGHIEGSSHHLWWLFAALGLACFFLGAALRLLARGWGGEDDESPNRDADQGKSTDRDADPSGLEAQPA